MQNRIQREKEADARKLTAQEAKAAKVAERQIQNNLKMARKSKKERNNRILATEEAVLEAVGGADSGGGESAANRPQRQKRLPRKFNDCEL